MIEKPWLMRARGLAAASRGDSFLRKAVSQYDKEKNRTRAQYLRLLIESKVNGYIKKEHVLLDMLAEARYVHNPLTRAQHIEKQGLVPQQNGGAMLHADSTYSLEVERRDDARRAFNEMNVLKSLAAPNQDLEGYDALDGFDPRETRELARTKVSFKDAKAAMKRGDVSLAQSRVALTTLAIKKKRKGYLKAKAHQRKLQGKRRTQRRIKYIESAETQYYDAPVVDRKSVV